MATHMPTPAGSRARTWGWWRQPAAAPVVLAVALLLAVLVDLWVARALGTAQEAERQRRLAAVAEEVRSRAALAESLLSGLQGLFMASETVSRVEFHDFVEDWLRDRRALGLQALQFARYVNHADKAAFEAQVRADRSVNGVGYPDFRIVPPGDRPWYVVTVYNEPAQGNEQAFGFDTAFGAVRLAALVRARDTGRAAASAPFVLVQSGAVGVVMRAAVYRRGLEIHTVEQRRAAYAGQVTVVFLAERMLSQVARQQTGEVARITLYDSHDVPPGAAIPEQSLLLQYGRLPPPTLFHASHQVEETISVADRNWRARWDETRLRPQFQPLSLLAAACVLSVGLSMTLLTRRLTQQRDQAQADAAALVEATQTGMLTVRTDGTILTVNPAAERLFGYGPGELIGQPLSAIAPDVLPALTLSDAARADATRGWAAPVAVHGRSRGGAPLSVAVALSDMATRGQVLVAFHDNSGPSLEQARQQAFADALEATVRDRTAELSRVNAELESFAYSVAHDLRAPLRHIHGYARVIEQQFGASLAPRAQELLARISRSASEMGTLVDELLNFSRTAHRPLTMTDLDMDELVARKREELQHALQGRVVHWRVGPLPRCRGDATLMADVITNLLDNALKYSRTRPESVIDIHGERAVHGAVGELRYCVADNGVGFDMAHAHQLFKVFSRLHHKSEFEGTGVGLANVARIIERHGGRVWATGQPGAGAQFWFALPDPSAGEADPATGPGPARQQRQQTHTGPA